MDICGYCGCTLTDSNALCLQCGKDHWIQPNDFNNPELDEYIQFACDNLNINRDELRKIICEDDETLYDAMISLKIFSENNQEAMI